MKDVVAVILAAGKGTRMKSDVPKVLHKLLAKPMLQYVIDAVMQAGITNIVVVIGHGNEQVRDFLKPFDVTVVVQEELLGSGDAVNAARSALGSYSGDMLVVCGDTPLLKSDTIKKIVEKHKASGSTATILTAMLKDPTGYGRIVRAGPENHITKIVEDVEANIYEKVVEEINVGTYCFRARELFDALAQVNADNKKKEYFLTDVIGVFHKNAKVLESVLTADCDEFIGINSRRDVAAAIRVLKLRIMDDIMESGVTVQDPSSTTIHPGVKIGRDTIIYPNTVIESDVTIGKACHIGPFTRIRPHVTIGDEVEVGNFVELNRSTIGDRTKIKHHTYLGDTTVGKSVNIGAGTITANYDGKAKHQTVIEDNAFIGVGAILIAPVKIGAGAVVGAGCVVPKNRDVPAKTTVVGIPSRILKK